MTAKPRRPALLLLHAAALAAGGWAGAGVIADARTPAPAAAAAAPEATLALPPGRWVLGDGTGFAPGPAAAPARDHLPAVDAPRVAVRVSVGNRASAEVYGPADLPAAVAGWRAAGWAVAAPAPAGAPCYTLRRGQDAATAWPLRPAGGAGCHLLIAATPGE